MRIQTTTVSTSFQCRQRTRDSPVQATYERLTCACPEFPRLTQRQVATHVPAARRRALAQRRRHNQTGQKQRQQQRYYPLIRLPFLHYCYKHKESFLFCCRLLVFFQLTSRFSSSYHRLFRAAAASRETLHNLLLIISQRTQKRKEKKKERSGV